MPAPDNRGMMCFDTPIPCCRPSPRGTRRPCDGSVPVGGDGVSLPAGAATARDALLQAYSDPGRDLSILIKLHTAAVLSTHRTGQTQFPDTAATRPELLAHHYTEAGCREQMVSY